MNNPDLLKLLGSMSLKEKVMQLVQLPGGVYSRDAAVTGVETDDISSDERLLAGSTLGIWGAEKLRRIQADYMDRHPHHIPLLFMLDVIHGHKTMFPCPLATGATFNPDLARDTAAAAAAEAASDGIHVTFSPMADLVRDARWGRVMESTGEDKLLNSRMAAAFVEGYQGNTLLDRKHLASCVKHYAAYGAPEAGRDYQNTELSEHTLREQYLPAYKAALDAGARLVMSSFNSWNGIPVTGSTFLLRDVLRHEMGFDGIVISDWGAVGELVAHGYAENREEAAYLAFMAGVDIDMCSGCYSQHLENLVLSGRIPEEKLDKSVMRVLKLKNELGLFDNPLAASEDTVHPQYTSLARTAVQQSLVLLENQDQVLPLKGKKIAVIGPYAFSRDLHSAWSVSGNAGDTQTLQEASADFFEGTDTQIRFAQGCSMLDNDTELNTTLYTEEDWGEKNVSLMAEAMDLAAWADTVILCLGEDFRQTGECASRTTLRIPDIQMHLLRSLENGGFRPITLVFCGRPLELAEIRDMSSALLICWRPGTAGAAGIWDVLTGRVSPSGKLPMSFPVCTGQEPLHYDAYSTGRPKPVNGPGRFTSRYLDCPNDPLYPFGYGLSYTTFSCSPVSLSDTVLHPAGSIRASAYLTNTGNTAGTETVMLFIRDLVGSRVRPVQELMDFRRVTLMPGEKVLVEFTITESMLRFWTAENRFASESGRFHVWIGTGSPAEFRLEKE